MMLDLLRMGSILEKRYYSRLAALLAETQVINSLFFAAANLLRPI